MAAILASFTVSFRRCLCPRPRTFELHSLAEHIRLLLDTGTKYVDKMYPSDEDSNKGCWLNINKSGMNFLKLLYLVDGDRKMVQNNPHKRNMCGEMKDEKIHVGILENQATDFIKSFLACHSHLDKLKPPHLGVLKNQLIQFSDFIMYELLDQHRMFQPTCPDDFRNFEEPLNPSEMLDKISVYIKSDRYKKNLVNNNSINLGRATFLTPVDFRRTSGFRFVHANVRSLSSKIDKFRKSVKSLNPDVMILTETWLNESKVNSKVSIDGYKIFRSDRSSRGGGVAIYVKNKFKVTEILSKSVPKQYEVLVLEVELMPDCIITIVGCYRPPAAPSEALCSLVETMSTIEYKELVLTGDLNWDWLSSVSDRFKHFCDSARLTQIIETPTRPNLKHPEKSTLLDLFLTSAPQRFKATAVFPSDLSDHHIIAAVRDTDLQPLNKSKRRSKPLCERAFLEDLQWVNKHSRVTMTLKVLNGMRGAVD